VQRIKKV